MYCRVRGWLWWFSVEPQEIFRGHSSTLHIHTYSKYIFVKRVYAGRPAHAHSLCVSTVCCAH